MQGGDISNRVSPKWIIQFEHVLADVPDEYAKDWKRHVRRRRWKKAAGCYEMHQRPWRILDDLYWRQDHRFEVVTFLGGVAFAEAVAYWLDRLDMPVSRVFYSAPDALAREVASRLDVQRVVHGEPDLQLTFGPQGLYVGDTSTMRML